MKYINEAYHTHTGGEYMAMTWNDLIHRGIEHNECVLGPAEICVLRKVVMNVARRMRIMEQ